MGYHTRAQPERMEVDELEYFVFSVPHLEFISCSFKLTPCVAIEPNLVKEYAEPYPQCTLSLDMAFCLDFVLSHIY